MSTDINVGLGEFKLLERFVVAMERIATKLEEIAPSTPTNKSVPLSKTSYKFPETGVFLDIPVKAHWVHKNVSEMKEVRIFGNILKLAETYDIMITRSDSEKLVIYIDEPGKKFRIRG